jgi:hypothetical protein
MEKIIIYVIMIVLFYGGMGLIGISAFYSPLPVMGSVVGTLLIYIGVTVYQAYRRIL